MDTKVYYNHKSSGYLITSNFNKHQQQIDLGLYPNADFEEVSIDNIEKYPFDKIAFDEVENIYFQGIKDIFSKFTFGSVVFHNSSVELSDIVLNVRHLLIGDDCKINLHEANFKDLKEITFLSVKTFKGKVFDKINSVEKLTLWYENKKANELVPLFPNLNELIINNGSISELNLIQSLHLEKLQLHRCPKLERISLVSGHHLKSVILEGCKKLDTSNLGKNVSL